MEKLIAYILYFSFPLWFVYVKSNGPLDESGTIMSSISVLVFILHCTYEGLFSVIALTLGDMISPTVLMFVIVITFYFLSLN